MANANGMALHTLNLETVAADVAEVFVTSVAPRHSFSRFACPPLLPKVGLIATAL